MPSLLYIDLADKLTCESNRLRYGRLNRTDLRAGSGDVKAVEDQEQLHVSFSRVGADGRERAIVAQLRAGRVLVPVWSDGSFDEWRVGSVESGRGKQGVVEVQGVSLAQDLLERSDSSGGRGYVSELILGGERVFDFEIANRTARSILETYVIPNSPPWLTLGTVEPLEEIPVVSVNHLRPWGLALAVRDALRSQDVPCELELAQNGVVGYRLNLVTAIGVTATTPVYHPSVSLVSLTQRVDPTTQQTRIFVFGSPAPNGLPGTTGWAQWRGSTSLVAAATVNILNPELAGGAGFNLGVGATYTLSAEARDEQGDPFLGAPVLWESNAPGVATIHPVTGLVTAVAIGSVTFTARCNDKSVQVAATVTTSQNAPATVTVTPNVGTVAIGNGLPLSASIKDAGGLVLPARTGTWSDNSANTTVAADSGDDAHTSIVTGVSLGPSTVTFTTTVGSITGTAAISVAQGSLSITTQPDLTVQNDVVFSPQPVLQLLKDDGTAWAFAGVSVTAAIASGPAGTLGGTVSVASNGSGVITYTNLKLTGPAGNYVLQFTAVGVTPISSATVNLAGAATKIDPNSTQSLSAAVNTAVSQPPSVLVRDASNNPVAGRTVTFAVTAGGGSITGSATIDTNAVGVATVGGWVLGSSPGTDNNTLTATASGLTGSPVTFLGSGVSSATDKLTVTTQPPTTAVNDVTFSSSTVIQLRNSGGAPLFIPGVTVTAEVASGPGVIGGTLTAVTNGSGVATFSALKLTGVVGGRTIRFYVAAGGYLPITSTTVTLTAGAATTISAVSATSQSSTVSQPVSIPVQVKVVDQSGNPVSGTTVTWAVTGGGGTRSPTTSVTNASGIATTTWTLGSGVGTNNNTLTASA